jgi:glyoxylase-like metal-dependent hydrolase (beta-lactamase superfamily II)
MERLLAFDFEWVLPGHGPRFHGPAARMRALNLADALRLPVAVLRSLVCRGRSAFFSW